MPHLPGAAKDYTLKTEIILISSESWYIFILRSSYLLKATEPNWLFHWLFPFHPFLLDLSQSFPDDGRATPRHAAPRHATPVMDA